MDFDEKRKHYENYAKDYDCLMLITVIDYAKMGLKGIFMLNGAAAVAMLTLFTNALISRPEISNDILRATYCFAVGALVSVLAVLFAYFSQIFFQYTTAHNNGYLIVHCELERNWEIFKQCFYNSNLSVDEDRLQLVELINQRDELLKNTDNHKKLAAQERKKGELFKYLSIICALISFYQFFSGITHTIDSFENQNEQILSSELTHPKIQTISLTATKL